jgi:hypothetical protein
MGIIQNASFSEQYKHTSYREQYKNTSYWEYKIPITWNNTKYQLQGTIQNTSYGEQYKYQLQETI